MHRCHTYHGYEPGVALCDFQFRQCYVWRQTRGVFFINAWKSVFLDFVAGEYEGIFHSITFTSFFYLIEFWY